MSAMLRMSHTLLSSTRITRTSRMPRTSTWYPIELPLKYESITRTLVEGRGYTVALNSKIVLFCSDQDLSVGLRVRVVISWPAKLADGTALSLSVVGRIERSESRQVE